eukprot:CAMPEP_0173429480 /NCGR_PEP_ID=MMETSP1357-20121228/8184_1 /TAXON_ID=77926 /ORGANISM="Hemiselmis rufescens, Strain PCC563" /LENGTH=66 /DNA_ID=CAMNT_0014393669 /DNA_START=183 /DNA_END=383 /DNA_ORIENTATION=-
MEQQAAQPSSKEQAYALLARNTQLLNTSVSELAQRLDRVRAVTDSSCELAATLSSALRSSKSVDVA